MASDIEYLQKRYRKMSAPQLELIIKQINNEIENNPESNREELRIAMRALEEKRRVARKNKKNRPCLPSSLEHGLDVGEEF